MPDNQTTEAVDRPPLTHDLKAVQPWFDALWRGIKTAELRKHDRDYRIGDLGRFREFLLADEGSGSGFTGAEVTAEITHIVTSEDGPWLAPGYCMLSLSLVEARHAG